MLVQFNKTTKLSESEMFWKDKKATFSENEIAVLMKANGGEKEWKRVENFNLVSKSWWLADGSIFLTYNTADGTLMFISKAASLAYKQKTEDEARKNLSEF